MCAPVALGLAQAGVGAMGAIGQGQAAQAQYQAQKQAIEMQRRQMIADRNHRDAQDVDRWSGELEVWQAKKSNFREQQYENRDAAGRAYAAASMQEEKLYRDFIRESANVSLQEMSTRSAGLGSRGNTANRLDAIASARAGDALSEGMDNILYGKDNIKEQKYNVMEEWANNARQQWKQVSIAPRPTMRSSGPTFLPGDPVKPSNTGVITGIAQAALSGLGTFNKLSPPGQGLFGMGGGGNRSSLMSNAALIGQGSTTIPGINF